MVEDNPSTCKRLTENKIRTLYFRDKDSEVIKNNEFLTEVSNVGEICRQIFTSNGLRNSTGTYEKLFYRQNSTKFDKKICYNIQIKRW